MQREDVEFRTGECWMNTFVSRRVVVALDCSWSMKSGTEKWRFDSALAEVKAIVNDCQNLAEVKGITLIPFSNRSEILTIRRVEEVAEKICTVLEDDFFGRSNNWSATFDSIHACIDLNNTKRPIVFLVSDMECTHEDQLMHKLWTTVFPETVRMHLCCIGNSTAGLAFYEKLLNKQTSIDNTGMAGERPFKRIKPCGNLEIVGKHISMQDDPLDMQIIDSGSNSDFE